MEEAIKRELREELNVEFEIIKELGIYDKLCKTWRLDGKYGLDGEFGNNTKIVEIDKETLLAKTKVFREYGIKID